MEAVVVQSAFNRFLKLSLQFLAGSTVASLAVFAASLLLAKTLTLAEFGILALIQASLAVIEGLTFSQSWQALVRFMPKTAPHSEAGVGRLLKYCISTDLLNAIISIVLLILAFLFSTLLGIDSPELLLTYGLILPFRMNGTWQGLARTQNKLKLINYQLIIAGVGKLLTALVIYFNSDLGLSEAVVGFTISEACGYMFLILSSIQLVNKDWGIDRLWLDSKVIGSQDNLVRKFLIINHFNVSSVLAIRNIDELIVGKLISVESAGVYKLIKLIAALLSKVIEPMYIVIYPEFNRLLSMNKFIELKSMLKRITAMTFSAALLFIITSVLLGETALNYFTSSAMINGFPPLIIYVIGMAVNMMFFYAHPLAISLGLESFVLKANLLLGASYIAAMWYFGNEFGLLGISICTSFYMLSSAVVRLWGSSQKLKDYYE